MYKYLLLAGMVSLSASLLSAAERKDNPERWEKDIARFEAADEKNPPQQGGVLFVGSSSIRRWDLKKYFPEMNAINRGFGGSQLSDSIHYADRIIFPYKPRAVVIYAGDNDLAQGESPDSVTKDYQTLAKMIHEALPEAQVLFIAIKPCTARKNLIGKVNTANTKIQELIKQDPRETYIDVYTPMMEDRDVPTADWFVSDGLHLSDKGYTLWMNLVNEGLKAGE